MRAESISTRLRRSISAGEYSPGEKLNEVAVAQKMGVSRNTLRESFSTLAADGILERIPNRGVFIASPTAEEVLGLFRERAIIEPGALLWGDALDVDVLDRIVAEAEVSLEEEETISTATTATLARMNQIFHRTVVQAVGSSLLNEEMDRLLARMRLVFLTIEHTRPTMHGEFVPINRKIVSLLRCGDRAGAADTLRKSLVETGDSMSALLQVPVYTAAPTVVPD